MENRYKVVRNWQDNTFMSALVQHYSVNHYKIIQVLVINIGIYFASSYVFRADNLQFINSGGSYLNYFLQKFSEPCLIFGCCVL